MSDRIRRQHRFTVTPEHLILDPRINDRAFRLWCRLDRFAGENEVAFPTRETLSIELDTSKASIDRAIRELCEAGWLTKERRSAGDANLYTLMVAPEKDTERLIKAARRERVEATKPRRDKERSKRRDAKRRVNVNGSDLAVNVQVTQGGVVTSDETPDPGGVVMGDDTGVVTGDERGVVTGDAQKEAPTEGGISEGPSAPSLRSEAGATDSDSDALFEDDGLTEQERKTGRGAEGKPLKGKKLTALAQDVAKSWWDWMDAEGKDKPAQSFIACRQVVKTALGNGHTPKAVKYALVKITDEHKPVSGGTLTFALGGDQSQGMRRNYDDVATWGRPEDDEPAKVYTDEEAAAIFGGGRKDLPPAVLERQRERRRRNAG